MDKKGLIGANNKLPWHLPEDLKRFKKITMGHPIIMGRKTFESIGRVLPGRKNIVITRDTSYAMDGVSVFHSISEVINEIKNEDESFVIGGSEIYSMFLPHIQKWYLTVIEHTFKGNVYLPKIDFSSWKVLDNELNEKTSEFPYSYRYITYIKN